MKEIALIPTKKRFLSMNMLTPKDNLCYKIWEHIKNIKNPKGSIFIFCKKAPCFIGDKQTTISCFEYYSKLMNITNKNLKIKIFFPKKIRVLDSRVPNSTKKYDSIFGALQWLKGDLKTEDFENEYIKNNQLIAIRKKHTSTINFYSKRINYQYKDYIIALYYINPQIHESHFLQKMPIYKK